MERKYLSLIFLLIFVAGYSLNNLFSENLDIRKCDFNEKYNLKGYNNIGESMNLKDNSVYANSTMIPKRGDIVIIKENFSDGATGFVHRVKAEIGEYYLIKGDNNNIYDGFYNKNRIKGVVICQE